MSTMVGGPRNLCGERIVRLREARGWSQADLADHLLLNYGMDLSAVAIGRIERGQRTLQDYELVALAAALGTTVDDIVSGDGAMSLEEFMRKPRKARRPRATKGGT